MNEDMHRIYNSLMNEYTMLDIKTKREEIIKKIQELIAIIQKICIDKNINSELLFNREIIDLNKNDVSDDDYLEGIFAYINMLEDILGKLLVEIL